MTTTNLPTPEGVFDLNDREDTAIGGPSDTYKTMRALAVWALGKLEQTGGGCTCQLWNGRPHRPDCQESMARAYLRALTDPAVAADQKGAGG